MAINYSIVAMKIPGIRFRCRGFLLVFDVFLIFEQFCHHPITISLTLVITIIFFP